MGQIQIIMIAIQGRFAIYGGPCILELQIWTITLTTVRGKVWWRRPSHIVQSSIVGIGCAR